jgi:putative transposase
MPDHFHVLLTPGPATSLERAIQFIKGGSAKAIGDALHFRFPVWQRGFSDHRIRDAADYAIHVNYIACNPVRKRLSEFPAAYPWSSASAKFHCDKIPQGLKPRARKALNGTAEAAP